MARLALALTALALLALPGAGFHAPGLPVLDEVPLAADGWAAWRFTMAGHGLVSFDVEGVAPGADLISVNLFILRTDPLRFDSAFTFYNPGNGAIALHAQLPDPIGTVIHQRLAEPGGVASGVGVTMEPNDDSGFIAVALLGSDGGLDGRLVLYGDSSVQVHGAAYGQGAVLREADFQGGVNVVAEAAAPRPPGVPPQTTLPSFQARAIVDAAHTVAVEHALFGVFSGLSNLPGLQLSLDTPAGTRTLYGQPNGPVYEAWTFFAGDAAGSYTFRIDQDLDVYDTMVQCRVRGCGVPNVYVALADVPLP